MAGARLTPSMSSSLGLLAGTLEWEPCCGSKAITVDSGADRLDAVLAEIDLGVAAELAKAGMS